jgi:hypothetical protein
MTHSTIFSCPHCGAPTDVPQLFKRGAQQVFDYIWRHPGCTVKQIQKNLYSFRSKSNLAGVLVSKVRQGLATTDYQIIHGRGVSKCSHRYPYTLTVVKRLKPESSPDVSPQLPARVL